MLLRAYLITYNLACILGWAYINWIVASHLTGPHRGGNAALWAAVGAPLKLVQTAALLEVLHAALGWVRSNPVTAFIQGVARNIVLWTMISISPAAQSSWALPLCVGAWAAVEVPRYLFYTCELLLGKGTSPYALAWLRYSLFVVLYPLGIAGEVGCLYFSLPAADQLVWAPGPGNALNFAYNHGLVLRLLVALYPPGSYTMVAHMWDARAKWLRAGAEKEE